MLTWVALVQDPCLVFSQETRPVLFLQGAYQQDPSCTCHFSELALCLSSATERVSAGEPTKHY